MLVITADVHERASRIPLILGELGVQVDVRALARGDYIVGPATVVERKAVGDLHDSIETGRFWNQIGKLRSTGHSPVLLIEGPSLFRGPIANDAIRGVCLSVTDLGIAIVRTEDARDTAAWLYSLASRRREGAVRDRPVYAQRPQSMPRTPPEAALAAAPGISGITARTILERFGSLRQLCEAAPEDLQELPGV